MNYKKTNAFLIVILGLASLALTAAGRCETFQFNRCQSCFRSKPTKAGGCTEELPQKDDCVLYDRVAGGQCNWCKRQYTLKFGPTGTQCVKLTTPKKNCVYDLDYGKTSGQTDCFVCKGGYPDKTRQTCVEFSKTSQVGKDCAYAGPTDQGQVVCIRCNPGFVATVSGGKCIQTPVPGCLYYQVEGKTCLACNVWEGYSMVDGGKCVKVTKLNA